MYIRLLREGEELDNASADDEDEDDDGETSDFESAVELSAGQTITSQPLNWSTSRLSSEL